MGYERTHSFQKKSSHTPQPTTQFSTRPFAAPVQMKPKRQPTPEELENEAFNQNKFEAFGLQLKEKSSTITPVEQERLSVLQAKMGDFWAQRKERASRFSDDYTKIPVHPPEGYHTPQLQPMWRQGTLGVPMEELRSPFNSPQQLSVSPIQAKLTIGEPGDKYEEADRVASQVVEQIHAPATTQSTQRQSVQRSPQRQTGNPSVQSTLARLVIQRTADELNSWVTTQDDLKDEGHSFTESGGLIVINDSLDVSDTFWKDLRDNAPGDLKDYIQAAKALKDNNQDLTQIPITLQSKVKEAQATSGRRMRFRFAIGPTAGNSSKVEQFVANVVVPAYGGIDSLPEWITSMTPLARQRLYDLPNSGTSEEDHKSALKWAVAQTPASVSELVNFTEYYLASKGKLKEETDQHVTEQIEQSNMAIQNDDERLEAKKLELATVAQKKKLNTSLGKYFGKARKKKLEQADVDAITDLGIEGIGVESDYEALNRAAEAKAEKDAITVDLTSYTKPAKTALLDQDIEVRMNALIQESQTYYEAQLVEKLTTERTQVTSSEFADANVTIADFWSKTQDEQVSAIKTKAGEDPIPFTSSDSAAYHALKHYADIQNTVDQATEEGGELLAYLNSAQETVKNPESVERKQGQLFNHPSLFFKRVVDAASPDGASQSMKAIVIVTDSGDVKIATYFRG